MAHEAVVGRLADGAGVEQDQVGVIAGRRLAVTERLEHALHALGVVLVHLTPEGGQVVALSFHSGIEDSPGVGELRLHQTHLLPAPPERVFAAFAEPQQLARWWGPEGFRIPELQWDPRAGERYRIAMQPPE